MEYSYDIDENETHYQTFGGQVWLDSDWYIDEYGFQLGDVSIHKVPSSLMIHLACEMVNHLRANGHEFGFVDDPTSQDQPKKFTLISNTEIGQSQK